MDFDLTKEQLDIQKAAAEFAEGEFDPDAVMDLDENAQFPDTVRKKACELGFIGMQFPEKYDGAGFGLLESALVIEAFCRQESGMGMALALSDFGAEMILRHGSEAQKQKVLPQISQGKGFITMQDFHINTLADISDLEVFRHCYFELKILGFCLDAISVKRICFDTATTLLRQCLARQPVSSRRYFPGYIRVIGFVELVNQAYFNIFDIVPYQANCILRHYDSNTYIIVIQYITHRVTLFDKMSLHFSRIHHNEFTVCRTFHYQLSQLFLQAGHTVLYQLQFFQCNVGLYYIFCK